jgi:RimJ/RimL family protein N-acetyltransferase
MPPLAATLPLYTPRLRLRRLVPGDFAPLLRLYQDPGVMRFMGGVRTREQSLRFFEGNLAHWERHGFGMLAVEPREAPDRAEPLLGRVGLTHLEDTGDLELAYLFAPPAQGQGLATEAGARLLAWGFEALGLPRIVALALPGNGPSLRVMRRLGLQPDGTAHHHGFDVVRFVLTRAEWEARRAAQLRAGRAHQTPAGALPVRHALRLR